MRDAGVSFISVSLVTISCLLKSSSIFILAFVLSGAVSDKLKTLNDNFLSCLF